MLLEVQLLAWVCLLTEISRYRPLKLAPRAICSRIVCLAREQSRDNVRLWDQSRPTETIIALLATIFVRARTDGSQEEAVVITWACLILTVEMVST